MNDTYHFENAAPTNPPKSKNRTACIISPARNIINAATKETINPKKSTLYPTPLADTTAAGAALERGRVVRLDREVRPDAFNTEPVLADPSALVGGKLPDLDPGTIGVVAIRENFLWWPRSSYSQAA